MENLIFLTCFVLFAFLTAVCMLVMGYIFSYKSPDKIKSSTYECGLAPETSAKINFNIKYFNYLIMYLIFDISVIFIYPLLVTGVEYSKYHLITLILFLLLLLTGIFCAFKYHFIRSKNE